jgi:NhaA family Na+:H+ antiporter
MVVPALIYVGFNLGTEGARGWGVPMATDIAFAVGVLALVGRTLPISVKVFLLAIAIVDDLGAVLVIAIFYTDQIHVGPLGVAAGFLAAVVLLKLMRVHSPLPYMLLGIGLWAATLASGVHSTIAGVLLAFTIPATRVIGEKPYIDYMKHTIADFERDADVEPSKITQLQSHALKCIEEASQGVQTTLARVEHALLAPVTFIVIPLFALANAGVVVGGGGGLSLLSDTLFWGVTAGLVVGKPLGVLLASWLAIRTGLASLPDHATWRQITGVSVLCGIGFTMSLFVTNLAFPGNEEHLAATKVGILLASLVAGLLGGAILLGSARHPDR